jgi:hypothetical protein
MLSNLGYTDVPSSKNYVRDFEEEWGHKATGEQSHILELIEMWHSTGKPPEFAEGEEETTDPWGEDVEPEEEDPDGECGDPDEEAADEEL